MERNDHTTRDTSLDNWTNERLAALRSDNDWQPSTTRGLAMLDQRQNAQQKRARKCAWLAAGAAATCVPLVAMPTTRAFAQRCVSACVSQSSVLLELISPSSPSPSSVYIRPEDRSMAPDFTLTGASGEPVTLSALRGKVVLLNFWATWCLPCKTEIPWFVEFQKTRANAGFEVVGVSLDDEGWKSVKPFIAEKQVNYRIAIGNSELTDLYGGVSSLPASFIIDRAGRIAAVHLGLCSKRDYEGDIDTLLREP